MLKTAKKKHVKEKTRPQIERGHKYQLLCQQANNCLEKEPVHKSCEM